MLQRPYTLDEQVDDSVPTWSSDGDGMVVIEHLTTENTQLHSRIPDGEVRPVGYVVFNEMDPLHVFPTLPEAIAYATGYWDGAYQQ